jgi:hypothetical protein
VLSSEVKLSIMDLLNLLPWERNTYFGLYLERLEQEKEAQKDL